MYEQKRRNKFVNPREKEVMHSESKIKDK